MTTFASALSQHPDPRVGTAEAIGSVCEQIGSATVGAVFTSGSYNDVLAEATELLGNLSGTDTIIGATACGVLGGSLEIENDSAISIWLGDLPGAHVCRFELLPGEPPILAGVPSAELNDPRSMMILLADPFSMPTEPLLSSIGERFDVVGGFASAGRAPNTNSLVLNDSLYHDGAVGISIPMTAASTVVSQGCRPIGLPWVVTSAEGPLISALGGKPALERLTQTLDNLSRVERNLAARGLSVGVLKSANAEQFTQGDFLVRSLLGADRSTGAIAVGDAVEVGEVVQFQIRDQQAASDELVRLLPQRRASALVFTCNGRGEHMFARANHDAEQISESVNGCLAGMFCAGEFGPIGGTNALHGFTATAVLFNEH